MIPFNVPKKSRVFPGEQLVAIDTPSFTRVTFLLRCMDLEMGPDSDVLVLPRAKLSHRYKSNKLLGVLFPQIEVRTRFEVMSGRQRSV